VPRAEESANTLAQKQRFERLSSVVETMAYYELLERYKVQISSRPEMIVS
jgi:hypothetical protein